MTNYATHHRWLITELADQAFGINVDFVQELINLSTDSVHRLPRQGDQLQGVIRVRDSVLPLFDLRSLLGMPSMRAETESVIAMLGERRREHIAWIKELESSVEESRPFGLATDPHACRFGKWYDKLMADRKAVDRFTNGNLALLNVLESFDLYHQRIHAIAEQVTQQVDAGDTESARRIIQATRDGDLSRMLELFDKTCELVASVRQGCVVLVHMGGEVVGLAVDEVCQVVELGPDSYHKLDLEHLGGLIPQVARDADGRLIQLLDLSFLQRSCDRLCTATP